MCNLRNRKGFTLIELMIVVVIIGILAAIAIPKFTEVSNGAKQAEAEPILKQICTLAQAYQMRIGDLPAALGDLDPDYGWAEPGATYFDNWAFNPGTGAEGTASTQATATSLSDAAMDCATRDVTLS